MGIRRTKDHWKALAVLLVLGKAETVDAEHMGANLLPCNAAARLRFSDFSPKECSDDFMAQIIEFYVPSTFRKTPRKWNPQEQLRKVIPFDLPKKKSA